MKSLCTSSLCFLLATSGALAKSLPEYDASAAASKSSLLWAASPGSGRAARGAAPESLTPLRIRAEQAARHHLEGNAARYGLGARDLDSTFVSAVHDTGRGPILVSLKRLVDGIEVFRESMTVAMTRDLDLVAISGSLPADGAVKGPGSFVLSPESAIGRALADYAGSSDAALERRLVRAGAAQAGYERFEQGPAAGETQGVVLAQPVRAKRVLFRLGKRLEPAFYIELWAGEGESADSDLYSYVISARDGRLLFRHDLTVADSYSYRAWADPGGIHAPFDGPQGNAPSPHPTGLPDRYQAPFVAPNLLTLANGPISTNDPWLPPSATVTTGNNAEAYADLASPDGFGAGDLRADSTSPGTFDRTYDTALAPQVSQNQEKAAITQLFYDVNFFHDWYYDSGFDEASGNAQSSNYGRGGVAGDSLRAEAQDQSGRNNANMSTPSDGERPRMQMYVFGGIGVAHVTVTTPPSIAGTYYSGTAGFGPGVFNLTGVVVLVNDGSGTPSDACQTPFANAAALSGKLALLDRGVCGFATKVKNAQLNGAIGAIVVNDAAGSAPNMSGTDATITIPSLSLSQADGNTLRAQLGSGVNATLVRQAAIDRDGTIDNQVVAHEWGHYISNRLIGDANGLNNKQGGGMGEGWGDFHLLLMTVQAEDALAPANAGWSGAYSVANYVTSGGESNGYYFGIRRVPYSIDFSKDPLTFQHISDGVPLPTTAPIRFGADGASNSEVHNTGEVWATMLWECYASLLNDTGRLSFAEARDRMREYLVAGYKLTPVSPTILDARDALLAGMYAGDPADFALCSAAFARRGAGLRAVAPERFSTTNQGVVESYVTGGDLALSSASLVDDSVFCDGDGNLDDTETGHLTLVMKNVGNAALTATSATVSCSNGAVTFPAGSMLAFPASQPFGTTSASLPVRLNGVVGIQALDFTLDFSDPGLAFPLSLVVSFRGNLDDVPAQSATDDVESAHPAWVAGGGSGALSWQRIAVTAYDHRWYGPDAGTTSDAYLISPLLHVAPTGSFSFTLRHRYSFEFAAPTTYYDGGVIEISTDAGASWSDIGASASPGYGGTIVTGGENPLEGRSAYVATSPSYPALTALTVNLGTAYQGLNVLVRFRIGTDVGVGGAGWEIDDIAFAGITNLPFGILVADRGICIDSDGDGSADRSDCAPADPTVFSVPTEARSLKLAGHGSTALTWLAPATPGGSGLHYDVLRSTSKSGFASASCLESNGTDLLALDVTSPAPVFFYLVRSENACGGNLGSDSHGVPRSGASCP